MKAYGLVKGVVMGLVVLGLGACGESPINVEALKSKPKEYVGSDTCKLCHLEHYDSWKMTLHSRMLQDAQKNKDAIIVPIDEKKIRDDLAKIKDLKVPADKIFIPKVDEILYTIGSQWKQRYHGEKRRQTLYRAHPILSSKTTPGPIITRPPGIKNRGSWAAAAVMPPG